MRERGRGSPVEAGGSARRIAESSAKALLGLSALGVSLPMTAAGQTTLPSSSAPVYLQSFPSGNPFTINLGTTLTGGFPNGAVSGNASSPWIITNNGTITTAANGIFLQSTQSHVTNNGSVTAGSSGTGVVTSGNSSVTNSGTITGGSGADIFTSDQVTNLVGGRIIGTDRYGIESAGGPASVTNSGTITGPDGGISFGNGGTVVNQAGGTISGSGIGVIVFLTSGTVTNAGAITGGSIGVDLVRGGSVTNLAGGAVTGSGTYGVTSFALYGSSTVTNAGSITAPNGIAVFLPNGTLTNQAGGVISGVTGVHIVGATGTVTNAGTITATGGIAIDLSLVTSGLVTLQDGAVVNGDILGSTAGGRSQALVLQGAGVFVGNVVDFHSLDVQPGATWTLGGANTIAATAVQGGGVLQLGDATHPGASITGTSLVLAPGSTLAIILTPAANAALHLSGTARLDGTLRLMPQPGVYLRGTVYTLVSASGGVNGSFATVTNTMPSLPFTVIDTPTSVLAIQGAGSFVAANGSPNENAVGAALAKGGMVNADLAALIAALDGLPLGPAQNAALDRFGGEAFADFLGVARSGMRTFLMSMGEALSPGGAGAGRVAAAGGAPIAAPAALHSWGEAFGHFASIGGDGNAHGLSSSAGGAALGVDRLFADDLTAGIGLGYGHTDFALTGLTQQGALDQVALGAYGEKRWGMLFLDGAAALGYDQGDSTRQIVLPGISRRATGGFDGFSGGALARFGARLALEPALRLEPSVSLIYSHVDHAATTETGAGAADLAVSGASEDKVQAVLGAKLTQRIELAQGTLLPELKVGWAHEFTDPRTQINESFAAIPGSGFTLTGAGTGRDLALLGTAVRYEATGRLSVYASYDLALGQRVTDHAVRAGVTFTW
jgi:uncharacterized protein with beta-barrel porin domain